MEKDKTTKSPIKKSITQRILIKFYLEICHYDCIDAVNLYFVMGICEQLNKRGNPHAQTFIQTIFALKINMVRYTSDIAYILEFVKHVSRH